MLFSIFFRFAFHLTASPATASLYYHILSLLVNTFFTLFSTFLPLSYPFSLLSTPFHTLSTPFPQPYPQFSLSFKSKNSFLFVSGELLHYMFLRKSDKYSLEGRREHSLYFIFTPRPPQAVPLSRYGSVMPRVLQPTGP